MRTKPKHMTKKLTIVLIIFYLSLPGLVQAQVFQGLDGTDKVTDTQAGTDFLKGELSDSGITHTDTFSDLIIKYINFILPYITLSAFAGLVWSGFLYVTSYGDEEQISKAKTIIMWSIIGLLLVIVSFAVVRLFTVDLVQGLNKK